MLPTHCNVCDSLIQSADELDYYYNKPIPITYWFCPNQSLHLNFSFLKSNNQLVSVNASVKINDQIFDFNTYRYQDGRGNDYGSTDTRTSNPFKILIRLPEFTPLPNDFLPEIEKLIGKYLKLKSFL